MSERSPGEASPQEFSRRKLITTGVAAAAGVAGLGAAARLAQRYGLVPPDHGGLYGVGETLTYASQRLLTRHSLAREFSRSQISKPPFPNEMVPPNERTNAFRREDLPTGDSPSTEWSPGLPRFHLPRSRVIRRRARSRWCSVRRVGPISRNGSACLSRVLQAVEVHPQARYVVYFSIEPDWWESIDMADALHPQKLFSPTDEWRRTPGGQWWAASAASPAPARL